MSMTMLAALAGSTALDAAERYNTRTSDTMWPGAPIDPLWPNINESELAALPANGRDPLWPAVPSGADDQPTGSINEATAPKPGARSETRFASLLASWPDLRWGADEQTGSIDKAPKPVFETRFPSQFAFEGGARYWYSIGNTSFAFTNGNPFFGNPTSTLDWLDMTGHSGEGFFRIDHRPSHLYVKGLVGGGKITDGTMNDLDFFFNGTKFSDTSSDIKGDNLRYAIVDLGYAFEVPSEGLRFGAFVGYHYWRERMTAFGVKCNRDALDNFFCGPVGSVPVPFSTPAVAYDWTWHAVRLGADAKIRIFDRLTIEGEAAFVPYARVVNEDSHLLRQSPFDLGPAPNLITHGKNAMGGEAEVFLNYAVLPHFQIGIGARYWGIFTNLGRVNFGPTFTPDLALTRFDTQRYGVLFQAKATF